MALDVRCLALEAAGGLVDHDAGVRGRETHVLVAGGEQQRAHRRGLADAQCRDGRPDELHRVVDRHSGGNDTARRIDVEGDFLLRIFRFQEQELGADQRRHVVLHRSG